MAGVSCFWGNECPRGAARHASTHLVAPIYSRFHGAADPPALARAWGIFGRSRNMLKVVNAVPERCDLGAAPVVDVAKMMSWLVAFLGGIIHGEAGCAHGVISASSRNRITRNGDVIQDILNCTVDGQVVWSPVRMTVCLSQGPLP